MATAAFALALLTSVSHLATSPLALSVRHRHAHQPADIDEDNADAGDDSSDPDSGNEGETAADESVDGEPECTSPADCESGRDCTDGICTSDADATCISDTECEADMVCRAGACEPAPVPAAGPNPSPAGTSATATRGDWALGGAIAGLAIGGAFYVMRGIAEGKENPTTAQQISLTSSADLLFLASVPIMAAAGASARQTPHARGIVGLRISGWLTYALGGLSFAAIDVLEDINVSRVNDGKSRNEQLEVGNVWRGFAYALTAASLVTMGTDTIISHVQAHRPAAATANRRSTRTDELLIFPTAGVDLAQPSPTFVAGVLGRF